MCAKDYKECAYINPSVKITINTPSGWHNDTTKVTVKVEDTIVSGNFTIQTVKAKVGQNGSWTDITEDMYIEISENSTIYVQVTDQKGKTYEKNRYIKCFDFTKPTLNAAVSDGLLSIQAHDTDSGIKAIYVNGYEFTEHTNGALNIRLQQFDAGYQYFTISAMDNAGNTSEIYKTANPYYTDPENKDSSEKDPAQQSHWPGSQCLMSAYSKLHHPVLIVRQIFTFSDLFFIIRLAFSYTIKYNTVFSTSE